MTLPCLANTDKTVLWTFRTSLDQPEHEVVLNSTVVNGWVEHFEIQRAVDGENNIVLLNATYNNTGYYKCIDQNGIGDVLTNIHLRVVAPGTFLSLT